LDSRIGLERRFVRIKVQDGYWIDVSAGPTSLKS